MSNNKKSKSAEKEVVVVEQPQVSQAKNASDSSSSVKNKAESSKKHKKSNSVDSYKKPASGFIYFLIFIIIATFVAATYYFWDIQQKQNRFIEQQASTVNSLQREVNKISSDINSASELTASHTQQLGQLSDQIIQTEIISQKAMEIVNRSRREWALSEIDYLLRMAHRRVEVARDVSGAIAALKGADTRIKEFADLNLFKIRKQIAEDIAGLNAIHQADVNGISLEIDGMIVYLSELPFKSVKEEIKVQLESETAEDSVQQEEQTFVDSVLETVKKIGDIKVHQRSIQAASSLEQQNQIEQLLRTYLLSSRLAALRFNQVQFVREVQQASELLRLHYDINDNRVQQMQKTLNDFSALQLSPDLPELTKAWTLLQKEINKTDKKEEVQENPEKVANKKFIQLEQAEDKNKQMEDALEKVK